MEDIQTLCETETKLTPSSERVLLRGPRVCDWVEVDELGPEGLNCLACPWMEEGQVFEVIFEDESGLDSYRFKARVSWTRDADDDLDVGLVFIGAPIHVRRHVHQEEEAQSLLERFAA